MEKIFYQLRKGGKRTLIFLHGGGGSSSSWDLTRPYFKKTPYTLLYIDLRGHGKSFQPANLEDYRLEKHSEDVKEVMGACQIEKAVLIGHCLGSMVAATFTALNPPMVEKLILINPGNKKSSPLFKMFSFIIPIFHGIAAKIAKPKKFLGGHVDYRRFRGSHDISLRRLLVDIKYTGFYSSLCQVKAFLAWDGEFYYQRIKTPTLIIVGKKDTIFPKEMILKLTKMVKGAKIEMIESNHISVINNPEEVARAIKEFL